jgi:hypothetical protein
MNIRILAIAIFLMAASILFAFLVLGEIANRQRCDYFSYSSCPSWCVVCPPCEVCSSVACRSQDFCESLGFNRTWYEGIQVRWAEIYGK